jgi:aspartyl aminopeptidase
MTRFSYVDRDFRNRTQTEVIRTEEMDPIVASLPPDTEAGQKTTVERLLALLKQQYDITAADLLSADIQLV